MVESGLALLTTALAYLAPVVPLVVAPRYIAGLITLGVLIQSAQAFQQMVGALLAIDNSRKVADWRASAERVFGLVEAVDDFDDAGATTTGKAVQVAAAGRGQAWDLPRFRHHDTGRQPQIAESMNVEIARASACC